MAGIKREADEISTDESFYGHDFPGPFRLRTLRKLANSFHSSIGVEMVDIFVGEQKKHFRLHKKLLCEKLPYFVEVFGPDEKKTSRRLPNSQMTSRRHLISWSHGFIRALYEHTATKRAQKRTLPMFSPCSSWPP